MTEVNVVLIHGFWSSLATWDSLADALSQDPELAGFRWHRLGYESPKLGLPFFPSRIPDYDDIAQSLKPFLATRAPEGPVVFVTHSQGGLILQRYLTWMLNEGRGRELARIQSIVMLACPHEGTDYLRSIRSAIGLRRNPQAASLVTFNENVAAARRTVLNQVVHADAVSDRECPIPIHVYAGRTDKVVSRVPAQSSFPNASVIPGDHFSIIDPGSPGSLTAQVIKRHLLEDVTTPTSDSAADSPGDARAAITSSGVAAFAADVGCQPGADDRPSRQVSLPSLTASELSMMPLQQAAEALEAMGLFEVKRG